MTQMQRVELLLDILLPEAIFFIQWGCGPFNVIAAYSINLVLLRSLSQHLH